MPIKYNKQMNKWMAASTLALQVACGNPASDSDSQLDVTSVKHSAVKRQALGNCWLYAHATWLESMLLHTTGNEYDVSETYWTYWDFYNRLTAPGGQTLLPEGEKEISTGGGWERSTDIIKLHGWVEEGKFILRADGQPGDTTAMSQSQACAKTYLKTALGANGSLVGVRDTNAIHEALQEAFSCDGRFKINLNPDGTKPAELGVQTSAATMLKSVKNPAETQSLEYWLTQWQSVKPYWTYQTTNGKLLPSEDAQRYSTEVVKRVMKALNQRQPVVMSFFVTFEAPNSKGVFNNYTLANKGKLGDTGGHMVVLHDYTVTDAPGELPDQPAVRIPEGDLPERKEAALKGKIEYLVAKNSWGVDRSDRNWIRDGFSRFSWDYLTSYYYDEKANKDRQGKEYTDRVWFSSVGREFMLPPGY